MSLQKWKKKKEKAANEGKLDELFIACTELAEFYTSKEEFENALEEYKEAKRVAEAANNTINIAVAHRMIGEVYSSMQKYDLAIKHELKYLELAKSKGDSVEEQRALANLGHMYLIKADTFANPESAERQATLEKAKKYCLLSLQVCEKLSNINKKELVEMQARLYLNLGLIAEQQSESDAAISFLNRAINLCKSMDIWEILYRSYNSLACLFQHQSNHAKALENFDKAMNAAQRLQDKNQHICDLLLLKADVLFNLPDFRGAKQSLLKAYKLNTENQSDVEKKLRTVAAVSRFEEQLLNTPDFDLTTKKTLYESLGDGCASMKSYSKAIEYYYLMLETAKNMGEDGEQLRPCYVSLSQTYKDNKQYNLALQYFNEELKLNSNDPVEACKTTLNIAEVLEIKEAGVQEIVEAYQQARNLAQTAGDHKLEARALSSLVQVLRDNNRLSDSRRLEDELENLKQKYGPLSSDSEGDEEDENTPDIGADICIEELSDVDLEEESENTMRTRKKCPTTKFRRNEKGEFPLHTACISGNLIHVKKLLEQGHPVNVRDHNGWLPLHEACNFGYLEIVEELLNRGAAINDKGTDGCDGMTPLLDAASCGNLAVMNLLLRRGASPVMRTNKGETVLDCLDAWRKRYIRDEKRDLDPDTFDQYNGLVEILRAALKKAGHKAESESRPISPPTYSASQSKSVRRSTGSEFRDKIAQRSAVQGSSCSSLRNVDDQDSSQRRCYSDTLRRNMDDMTLLQDTSATREYEDAMRALRRKPVMQPSSNSPPSEDRSALVDEKEVVDDWLIDDLGVNASRGVKRRRVHEFDGQPLRRPNRLGVTNHDSSRELETERRNHFRPISPIDILESNSNDSGSNQQVEGVKENEDLSELTELLESGEPVSRVRSQQHESIPVTRQGSAYQVPLSVFGVVRNPVSRQPEPEMSASQPSTMPVTQVSHQPPSQVSQMAPPSIKVRVEGKLLLIPLPVSSGEPLTVAWLASEAAKRYYSFEGVEPKLSVTTEDGAMLAPQDPVTLLLSYREVNGVVVSWKNHPITERYREACSELGTDVDEFLERCLDISEGSYSLNLNSCALDAAMLEPVFRASHHQSSLQHLILCDNRFGDNGMQLLAKLIPKLPHLRELDITCNGITYEGLNVFVHQVVEHQACKRLETLKLCHNQLGRSCLNVLGQMMQVTKALTCLSLKSTGVTAASFTEAHNLPLDNIVKLDIGHNPLGSEGARLLLRRLNPSRLEGLGLAHTGVGVVGEVTRWLAGGDPCRLRTLDLAYCVDPKAVFTILIQCLERSPLLEHLELTCSEVDNAMLQSLYRLPLRVLRLPGTRVAHFPPPPPPIQQLSCLSLNTPAWASQGPFGFVTNNICTS